MLRSLIICPDAEIRRTASENLAHTGLVENQRELDYYPEALEIARLLRAVSPQVVFLGVDGLADALAVAAEATRIDPAIQIVGLGRRAEPAVLLECMRAGIREFVTEPFTLNSFSDSVVRLNSHLEQAPAPSCSTSGRILAFLPAKGGVGATTVALNCAAAISRKSDGAAVVADFDLTSGLSRFLLKLHNSHSTRDAIERASQLDESLWPQLVTRLAGVDVLHSGPIQPGFHSDPATLHSLMEFFRRNYKAACVDLPGRFEPFEMEILSEAKSIIMVCTPEPPALHMAREKLEFLDRFDLAGRVRIVVNRSPRRPLLSPAEIERLLGVRVHATLANDYASVQRAVTEGTWLSPDTELARGIATLADALLERQSKPAAEPKKRLVEYFSIRSPRLANSQQAENPAV